MSDYGTQVSQNWNHFILSFQGFSNFKWFLMSSMFGHFHSHTGWQMFEETISRKHFNRYTTWWEWKHFSKSHLYRTYHWTFWRNSSFINDFLAFQNWPICCALKISSTSIGSCSVAKGFCYYHVIHLLQKPTFENICKKYHVW